MVNDVREIPNSTFIATDDTTPECGVVSGELLSTHTRVVSWMVLWFGLSCCVRFRFHLGFSLEFSDHMLVLVI